MLRVSFSVEGNIWCRGLRAKLSNIDAEVHAR
jgi:hypothetical protein